MPTFNVVDVIERSPTPIYTYIDGYAASAATLISIAGHKRFMGKHSLMLLHELSGGNEGTYKDKINILDTSIGRGGDIKKYHNEDSNIPHIKI